MEDHAFIGRQPVVDKEQKIVGYELFFRDCPDAVTATGGGLEADARVIVNALSNMGTVWLLGDKLAFFNISDAMFESDFLDLLPIEQAVLEVHADAASAGKTKEHLAKAKRRGFSICLDDFVPSVATVPLLEFASYVKIQTHGADAKKLADTLKVLKSANVKVIATKVETNEDFKAAEEAGIGLFQGYYFARPVTLSAKSISPAYVNIVKLMTMVRRNDEVRDIEAALKRDVALSFKLLRFINSTGFGLSCEIQSFRHAVTILGYEKLYRWLSLLLTTADKNASPPALMKTAATRGRLAELLGKNYFDDPADYDNLFVVGMFSLLDIMLDMPMEQVLEQLFLPENVTDALLGRQGAYGPFLDLAEACENPQVERMQELAGLLQLSPQQVNQAHMEALVWVEGLGI